MSQSPKLCEKCRKPTKKGYKYCFGCGKWLLKKMAETGYLTPVDMMPEHRPAGMREAVRETKFGSWHG